GESSLYCDNVTVQYCAFPKLTTTELFWDLNAIKWLVEGRGDDVSPFENIPVPDLTYNKGAWQFG
ncbi:hypothetical protein ACSYPS_004378, partial [Shigella flexneri]